MIYISTGLFENKASQTAKKFIKKKIYNIELSAGRYEKNYINSLKLLNKDKKISLAVHNYFPTPKKPFVFNLASLDDKIFKLSFKHAKKAIKLAKTLGGKYYSFHAGFLLDPKINSLGKKLYSNKIYPRKLCIRRFINRVNLLAKYAARQNIEILIENNVINKKNINNFNLNPLLMTNAPEAVKIMRKTKKNVNLLIDVGHLKVSSKTENFNKIKYLKKVNKWIKGYHLSDNNGIEDQNNKLKKNSWFWKYLKKDVDYISLEIKNKDLSFLKKQLNLTRKKILND